MFGGGTGLFVNTDYRAGCKIMCSNSEILVSRRSGQIINLNEHYFDFSIFFNRFLAIVRCQVGRPVVSTLRLESNIYS
jgi:hypothetical protein